MDKKILIVGHGAIPSSLAKELSDNGIEPVLIHPEDLPRESEISSIKDIIPAVNDLVVFQPPMSRRERRSLDRKRTKGHQ